MTAEGFVHGVTNDFAKEGAEHAHDQRPAMDVQKEELDTQKTPDRDDMKGIMTGVAAVADTRCSDPDPDALSTASNTHLESQKQWILGRRHGCCICNAQLDGPHWHGFRKNSHMPGLQRALCLEDGFKGNLEKHKRTD